MRTLLFGAVLCQVVFAAQPVHFKASDGVTVFGEYTPAFKPSEPIILLFHQAGSSHAEYDPIVPKLVGMGFSCLAIDQRSGDGMYGHNRTAAEVHSRPSYMDAKLDLEAALDWATRQGNPHGAILWGSSYSAALVFLVAAEHPGEVKAVLSFSPGEYLGGTDTVQAAAAKVTCPVFIDTAKNPKEIAAGKTIFNAVASKSKIQFEPGIEGVHGSSTLRLDKNPRGAAENWKAVDQFLSQFR